MTNPKLKKICSFVADWCDRQRVQYSLVCDETDLQGVLLLRKDRSLVRQLATELQPLLATEGVHLETKRVRGGTILAFSLKALSESQLAALIAEAGEEVEPMTFEDKLDDAFTTTVAEQASPDDADFQQVLFASAARIAEGQYKMATQGATRANQTSLQRQRVGSDRTLGGATNPPLPKGNDTDDPQATTGASQPSKGPPARFESRIRQVFGGPLYSRRRTFHRELNEALDGMATATGQQPGDLFSKFAQALVVLGQNMGIGPLQQQLKSQGINWKKSDDGQSIILYVVNAQTKAPQPIARISAETLEKPSDFEAQLLNIMDFAKGDAPGTFKQKQQEMQAQERAVRDIAKTMGPQDPNTIAQQMQNGGGMPGAAVGGAGQIVPAANGQTPPAPPPAPQAAATQAAMPKPGM